MQAQRGVALIMVLVLLASTAMIGISAMQGSLLENKQAASYRAAALVQMASEEVAVKLLADPANSALSSCTGYSDWSAFNAFGNLHPAVQLECRQCVGSLAGHCPGPGDRQDVVIDGMTVEHSVAAAVLLRAQLVDEARARVVSSRTLLITHLNDETDTSSTVRWQAL